MAMLCQPILRTPETSHVGEGLPLLALGRAVVTYVLAEVVSSTLSFF